MAFFDKAGFDKLPTIEEKIKRLYIYLGNLESNKIVILRQLNSAKDPNDKRMHEERFRELCEKAEEIEKGLIKLNREERKVVIDDV